MKPALAALFLAFVAVLQAEERLPNIVIMFTDDQGYGDVGCYGAEGFETPNLDRLAAEGVKFTDFYVSSPVCSASRAALMTGCYNERVGITSALMPKDRIGLNPDETTIAEICKSKGYATAAIGKWHLGRPEKFLPTNHGFDEFFGIPYSNDLWPYNPQLKGMPMEQRLKQVPHLPLIDGTEVIYEYKTEDQSDLTGRLTERALDFIDRNHEKPFFLYLAHPQPHVPLFVSPDFAGKTKLGLYGDVIAEIDWSMGRILAKLEEHGIDDDTLVVFSSDNGPWLIYGQHSGSAGPLREGKNTCWDGGVRVPFLARWPGKIPAGKVCSEVAATIDLLPTIAGLIDAQLPEHKIDGKDIWPLLASRDGAKSPHDALFFYFQKTELHSLRSGKWKLILPHEFLSLNGAVGREDGTPISYTGVRTDLGLYDVTEDIGESKNLAEQHPEVVAELMKKVEAMRAELGDSLKQRQGSARRNPGQL